MYKPTKRYNINHFIKAPKVRLVGEERNEVTETTKALAEAQSQDLDLVEIAPRETPPVCKIIDFKKFLYQQKHKEQKGKRLSIEQKEFRISPNIGEGDLRFRIERAKEFLLKKNSVKITVMFSGREISHPEVGEEKVRAFRDGLSTIGHPDSEIAFDRKTKAMWLIIKPT